MRTIESKRKRMTLRIVKNQSWLSQNFIEKQTNVRWRRRCCCYRITLDFNSADCGLVSIFPFQTTKYLEVVRSLCVLCRQEVDGFNRLLSSGKSLYSYLYCSSSMCEMQDGKLAVCSVVGRSTQLSDQRRIKFCLLLSLPSVVVCFPFQFFVCLLGVCWKCQPTANSLSRYKTEVDGFVSYLTGSYCTVSGW